MKLARIGRILCLALVPLFLLVIRGTEAQQQPQQYPILDKLADKVIQKYQSSSCQELIMKKAQKQPPSPQEERAIQFLKSDPQMRHHFIDRVAAPIANKMFDCGMIP
ncbi:MAG TPA: hypothetical protein VE178_05100 [Silvibacterium sp.]|jgi:hypothetical protein|nr:hypothetical protein [Silvibacterium sp.]